LAAHETKTTLSILTAMKKDSDGNNWPVAMIPLILVNKRPERPASVFLLP
jgi:hypothetical protein